jgi:hypothetical protein
MDEAYGMAYLPQTERAKPPETRTEYEVHPAKGAGWAIYAGTVVSVLGVANAIYGLAAVSDSGFFVNGADYVTGDLNTWGWIVLVIGVVQIAAALAIWREARWGPWIGIPSLAANAMVQLLWMPSYPLAALALFAASVLALYGLIAADS